METADRDVDNGSTDTTDRPVVGVVGGGQLARMMAQAADPLALPVRVLAGPRDEGAVASVRGDVTDPGTLLRFADDCDVLTFDHENVPLDAVRALEDAGVVVRPGSATLALSDKAELRRRLGEAVPLPAHAVVHDAAGVTHFAADHGWPVVVKAARGGYDGRGVHVVADRHRAAVVCGALQPGVGAVVEPLLDLDAELAVVLARRPGGDTVTYPVVQTRQVDGICHEVVAPAPVDAAVADEAASLARRIAELVGAVGVLAVELFVTGGRVLVNELAPRPHNSGHWSIDGATTSQFENHLRAVLDWPLGPATLRAPTAMVNLIAGDPPLDPRDRRRRALELGDVRLHLYDKTPRPGRKVGHVTAVDADAAAAHRRAMAAAAALGSITAGGTPVDQPVSTGRAAR